jgi:hypothetical protein
MVDQADLKEALAASVRQSKNVRVSAQGSSMGAPYHQATQLMVQGRDHTRVKVGSIILFTSSNGWMAHRVIRILGNGSSIQYATKGDANHYFDGPYVTPDRLLGTVVGWVKGDEETVFGWRDGLRAHRKVFSGQVLWIWRAFRIRGTGKVYTDEELTR